MDDLFDDAALSLAADAVAELRPLCPFELSALTHARLLAVCLSTLSAYGTLRREPYAKLIPDTAAACVQHLAEKLRQALVAEMKGQRGAHLAAGTVAGRDQTGGVDAVLGPVRPDPAPGVHA